MNRNFCLIALLLILPVIILAIDCGYAQPQVAETCSTCHGSTVEGVLAGPHAQLSCVLCHQTAETHASDPTNHPGVNVEAQTCGACHQLHYDDYRYVDREDISPQKMEKWPMLPVLLSGHAFAKDYREPRPHFFMLEDIELTTRGKGATCFTCKSADVYWQWNQPNGINFDSDVETLLAEGTISNPITCVMCHDPHITDIRYVQPALIEALERIEEDHPANKDPLNSRTCAQCHVNYNMDPENKKNEYPFVKLADMPDYMESTDVWTKHATGSWVHPELDVRLYKVQHPETELYWESVHWQAGVSCTDCHMPQIAADDGTVFTQHYLGSPINNAEDTCGSCHNETAERYREQIEAIQNEVYDLLERSMISMAYAITQVDAARNEDGTDQDLIKQAQDAYSVAHLNWEWIAAENSMGFHNPNEAREALSLAIGKAEEAVNLTAQARGELQATGQNIDARSSLPASYGLIVALLGVAAWFILKRFRR